VGDRLGRFSWWLGANYLNSDSQPISFVTNGTAPAGTTGAITALNKLGAAADVAGASGLLHSEMENAKLKLGYDVTPEVRLAYTLGFWANGTRASVETYLRDRAGQATFAGLSGFAGGHYVLAQDHLANSLSLKTDTTGRFDLEATVTDYAFLTDIQRNPAGVAPTGVGFTANGRITRYDGTGWTIGDLKGIWRPTGPGGDHEVSAGLHGDQYSLQNTTYNTATWQSGPDGGQSVFSAGRGRTRTLALWAQDAWRPAPGWKLTLGGRMERWEAFDGYNFSGTKGIRQPGVAADRFSPKASLSWQPAADWEVTGSIGRAYRFPTVSELYQLVQTGTTYTAPNADLRPEKVLSEELAVERTLGQGKLRLSLFQERVTDAIVSQTAFLAGAVPVTYNVNVADIRNRGIELSANRRDVLIEGLELGGSVTYVDSRTLSDPNFASSAGTTATGKRVPYVPDWRATLQATYRPDEKWALSVAGRYSGKQYSTLDNTDRVGRVFGAFDSFIVADVHVHYQLMDRLGLDAGIDNINDEKYFLYHPFPGRTFFGDVKLSF
jgi:iron complex outermembrane receptor protein